MPLYEVYLGQSHTLKGAGHLKIKKRQMKMRISVVDHFGFLSSDHT